VANLTEGVRASYCARVASLLINLVVRKGLTDVEFESEVEQMLFNYEGQRVPQVTFRMFGEAGCYDLSTTNFFEHRTVVAFAAPGAFTYPYSPIQLLSYNESAGVF
jgi:hypothetical protein